MSTGSDVEFSVIMCSVDPAKFARVSANYACLFDGLRFEIVGIHDAASLCEGYARGVRASRGRLLVLSHDDIEILTPDFADRVRRHLATYDLIGIAGTTRLMSGGWADAGDPYRFVLVTTPRPPNGTLSVKLAGGVGLAVPGIQALDGVFWAMRREVAERVGFDAETFDHFHLYDLDFTFRAHLAGFRLAVCRDLAIVHDSMGNYDATWRHYRRRFEQKFAGRLAARLQPRFVAQLRVELRTREEVLAFCEPARVADMIAQIERALHAAAAPAAGP